MGTKEALRRGQVALMIGYDLAKHAMDVAVERADPEAAPSNGIIYRFEDDAQADLAEDLLTVAYIGHLGITSVDRLSPYHVQIIRA